MKTRVLTPEYLFQNPFRIIFLVLWIAMVYYMLFFPLYYVIFTILDLFTFVQHQQNNDYNFQTDWQAFWRNVKFMSAISTLILSILLYKLNRSTVLAGRLVNSYLPSIQEALRTEYPDGIVYILDNILKQFKRFDLDLRPYRISSSLSDIVFMSSGLPSLFAKMERAGRRTDVKGFPNLANLREAMNLAEDLSREWLNLNSTERSRAMTEIRAKIKEEDMQISVGLFVGKTGFGMQKIFSLNKVQDKNIYWFSYTEEDHQNNQSFSHTTPQTPTPKPQPPSNLSQVLSFKEWVNQNPALQHFSEKDQREGYQKYLKSKGVNLLSFDEFLSQNSGLQFFSEEEQKQAYQRYLDSL